MSDIRDVQAVTPSSEVPLNFPLEVPGEVLAKGLEGSPEGLRDSLEGVSGDLAVPTPKSAKELGEIYEVSDRTIQTWFKTVCEAYYWIDGVDLRIGSSNKLRYTPLCQELIAAYRSSGLSAEQWVSQIHGMNLDKQTRTADLADGLDRMAHEDEEPIDVEWQEVGGKVDAQAESKQAAPIVQFQIQNLNVTLPSVDTSGLNIQAEQFQNQTSQAIGILKAYISADLQAKVGTVLAQNTQVVAAMHNLAVVETLQNLNLGKPNAEEPLAG